MTITVHDRHHTLVLTLHWPDGVLEGWFSWEVDE
jgi:hypothetical protein